MNPAGLYTYAATALVAAALASAGTWRVQEWRWQANTQAEAKQRAEAERIESEARDSDARQQRKFNDQAAGQHAAALARSPSRGAYPAAHTLPQSQRHPLRPTCSAGPHAALFPGC